MEGQGTLRPRRQPRLCNRNGHNFIRFLPALNYLLASLSPPFESTTLCLPQFSTLPRQGLIAGPLWPAGHLVYGVSSQQGCFRTTCAWLRPF